MMLLLLFLTTSAGAEMSTFPTQDAAAIAALEEAASMEPGSYEWAGLIYLTAEGYGYSGPETSGDRHGFELEFRSGFHYPRKSRVVALYHTHPAHVGDVANRFSDHDLETAEKLGIGSYIRAGTTGEVRYWQVGDPVDWPVGVEGLEGTAAGRLVKEGG